MKQDFKVISVFWDSNCHVFNECDSMAAAMRQSVQGKVNAVDSYCLNPQISYVCAAVSNQKSTVN